jgi:hypothetical protein
MPHLTDIKPSKKKPKSKTEKTWRKPPLPPELVQAFLKAAAEDACIQNTFGCEVFNEFEQTEGCEVSNVAYEHGVLTVEINNKLKYNFRVEITEVV